MPNIVETENAPAAIGPYAQAVIAGDTVYCSGQIAIDPHTGQIEHANIRKQTRRVLSNLDAVLKAAGTTRDRVVKVTVYLADLEHFAAMNDEYEAFFGAHTPARAAVEVSRLPRDAWVEMDAIAVR